MTNDYIDYIRKQDAVNVVANTAKIVASFNYQYAIDALLALTPADVAPVVHSRWIKTEDGAECENCGREAVYQIVDDHWEYEPWCPHCGARMNKEE